MKMAEIEATNRCNTRCLHCPREAMTRPLGTMSWDTFEVVAEKILAGGYFEAVYFSGMGEPTLNPRLARYVAHLSPRIPVSLTTNASSLTHQGMQDLIGAGLDRAIVSFTGHTPELYECMSGGLSLAAVNEAIRELVRLGEGRTRVSANVSVALQNREYLREIRAHLEDLGVRDVTFAMCHNRGGYLDDPTVCQTPEPPLGRERCDIFANTLYVAWDGQVLSCCHDLAGQGYIGDLVVEDLKAILFRKQRIVETGVRFPMCEHCNDMYRFGQDSTPDGRPLSEWIYLLYGGLGDRDDQLMGIVRRQQARIQELEDRVAGYEKGRFIRFTRWLHRTWDTIAGRR